MFNKKLFTLLSIPILYVCYLFTVSGSELPFTGKFTTEKKRILVFTSSGGGGHVSASRALEEYLGNEFEVKTSYIFEEVLGSMDPVQKFSFGTHTGEQTYNAYIRKQSYRMINMINLFGQKYFSLFQSKATRLIKRYLQAQKPDLIISVVPVVNHAILAAAKQLQIPFLLIPTDLDPTTFVQNIRKPNYDKFHLGLAFDHEDILKKIESSNINKEQISVIGFPIRKNFFTRPNHLHIKKSFDIPYNKPVILLLMGAQGSDMLHTFVQELSHVTKPCHLVVVLGKNEKLRPKIEAIALPEHISITVVGFTNQVGDLMAVADLGIIKSGTVTYCEALYKNLPILLDATGTAIKWEKFNHIFTDEQEIGDCITRYREIHLLVNELLSHPQMLADMKKKMHALEKKKFSKEIQTLVQALLDT